MNMILPVFLIAAILMSGVPTPTSRVGSVVAGSPAERAGILPGDRVVAVGGAPITWWDELAEKLVAPGPAPLALSVEREGGAKVELPLERESGRERRVEGSRACPGTCRRRCSASAPDSPAAQAGVQTGDRVTALNGAPVANAFALAARAGRRPAALRAHARAPARRRQRDRARDRARARRRRRSRRSGSTPIGVAINGVDPSSPAKSGGPAREGRGAAHRRRARDQPGRRARGDLGERRQADRRRDPARRRRARALGRSHRAPDQDRDRDRDPLRDRHHPGRHRRGRRVPRRRRAQPVHRARARRVAHRATSS